MLLQELDKSKIAVLNPEGVIKKIDGMPKMCLSFFSKTMMKAFLEKFKYEKIAQMSNSTMEFPIYKVSVSGRDVAVYQSPVGAPACVAQFEQIIAMGVKQMLLVGWVGCLVPEIKEFGIIIPTAAIRDEGTSYHYLKESDEIEIDEKLNSKLEAFLKKNNVSYTKGKVWTTDAIFRETKVKVEARKMQGAVVVDMECSAMAAVAKFRNVKFSQMFYGADTLALENYDPRNLLKNDDEAISSKLKILMLAVDAAAAIAEE